MITEAELEQLRRDSRTLAALHAAGVDNWDGYADAVAEAEADDER